MILLRLVTSNLAVHRIRAALTIAAIALSVSLVVAVTSGYSSAIAAASKFLGFYMGTSDLTIGRGKGDPHGTFPQSLVDQLRADRQVATAVPRFGSGAALLDEAGKKLPGHMVDVLGVQRPEDKGVDSLQLEAGEWFRTSNEETCVIDQILAMRLKIGVGGTVRLAGADHPLALTVVGVAHKPNMLAAEVQTVYVPLGTLQKFLDKPGSITRIFLTLKPGTDVDAFKARILAQVEKTDPLLTIKSAGDMRKQMDSNLQGIHFLSYLGGTVSMVSATFIVFSALSMGVGERQRTLAMLRAIGALKSQVARVVVIEGMLLSVVGVVIGVLLGWLWVKILAVWKPDVFSAGVVLDYYGIAYGSLGSMGAALAASLLPAWSAARVDPLEAMTPLAGQAGLRLPLIPTLIGLACISIDPLLIFTNTARETKFYGHFILGLPGMMIGFLLISPMFVWAFERAGSAAIAMALGVRPALLRQQLSAGIWRAAGTCAALMVGLAILVVMQVEGHSMLKSWRLPDKFPDIFIWSPTGMGPAQVRRLENAPGIRKGELLPVTVGVALVLNENVDVKGANLIPQAAMFFGIDPDKALRMMELEFRDEQGRTAPPSEQARLNREAVEDLKKGRHVVITDEYYRLLGKKRGDTIVINTQLHGPVPYTVAGVVWSPGIDVMVSMFDMERQFDQRTATSMFGSLADARNDLGINEVTFFAANLDLGVDKKKLVEDMQKEAGQEDVPPAPATQPGRGGGLLGFLGIGASTRPATSQPTERAAIFTGLKQVLGMGNMQAGDVRQIKYAIGQGFDRMLLLLSSIAFASMGVAALGVTNTIMASIRSRRWQFGILRAVGVTRGQLMRLVLAEALLLGITGCALGLAAGLVMSVDANGLSRYILGLVVRLEPPWKIIGVGAGVVILTAALASLWPASTVAREEPLSLLQAGRAAA